MVQFPVRLGTSGIIGKEIAAFDVAFVSQTILLPATRRRRLAKGVKKVLKEGALKLGVGQACPPSASYGTVLKPRRVSLLIGFVKGD